MLFAGWVVRIVKNCDRGLNDLLVSEMKLKIGGHRLRLRDKA